MMLVASLLCLNSLGVFNDTPCGSVIGSEHQSQSSLCNSPLEHTSVFDQALPQSLLMILAFFLILGALSLHFEGVFRFFQRLNKRILSPPQPNIKKMRLDYRDIFVYLFSRGILNTKVYS
jgi:hypothetical protein